MVKGSRVISSNVLRLSKQKLSDCYLDALAKEHQCMMYLYNMGYSVNPTMFFENEFFEALVSVYPDALKKLTRKVYGNLMDTYLEVSYISEIEEDEGLKEVLAVYADLLKAFKTKKDIAIICENYKIPKKSDDIRIKLNLSVVHSLTGSNKFPVGSDCIADCIALPKGKFLKTVDINYARLEYLREKFGMHGKNLISSDDIDAKYLQVLLSGVVISDTEFGRALYEDIDKYYKNFYMSNDDGLSCYKYKDSLSSDMVGYCNDYLDSYRERLNFYQEVYMTDDVMVFMVDGKLKDMRSYTDFHIGSFLRNHADKKPISVYNQLHGLGGEFITKEDVSIMGYDVSGMPVTLYEYTDEGYLLGNEYYPLNVVTKDGRPVEPKVLGIEDVKMDYNEALKWLGVSDLSVVNKEIAKCVNVTYGEHTYGFSQYVGYLVQALICSMCDYTVDGCDSPSHVKLGERAFGWVDNAAFESACICAETIFKKLRYTLKLSSEYFLFKNS